MASESERCGAGKDRRRQDETRSASSFGGRPTVRAFRDGRRRRYPGCRQRRARRLTTYRPIRPCRRAGCRHVPDDVHQGTTEPRASSAILGPSCRRRRHGGDSRPSPRSPVLRQARHGVPGRCAPRPRTRFPVRREREQRDDYAEDADGGDVIDGPCLSAGRSIRVHARGGP